VPAIRLIQIPREGAPSKAINGLPEVALQACESTAALYQKVGFSPPWTGYRALCDSEVVGTCVFPAAPAAGRVEIAYFTFPPFENRGIATAMAAELI
jgi:RimJ/RimL family protein N-acetyltransferase